MARELNTENFDAVIRENDVVMVDFWATWCGPCRMVGPFIEQLAEEYAGRAEVCKVNVDECQEIAAQFGVASIPTVMVFKNGELVDKAVGARPKKAFEQMLISQL